MLTALTILRAFATDLLDSASTVALAVERLSECYCETPSGAWVIAPRKAQAFKPALDALLDVAKTLRAAQPPPTLPAPLALE